MDVVDSSIGTRIETDQEHTESFGIDGYPPKSGADLQKATTSAVGGDMALIEVPIE
jgi:hypothetical protein